MHRLARHPCPDGRILSPVQMPVNRPDCFPFVFAFLRSLSYLDKQLVECYHTSQQGKGVLLQDALPFFIPAEMYILYRNGNILHFIVLHDKL